MASAKTLEDDIRCWGSVGRIRTTDSFDKQLVVFDIEEKLRKRVAETQAISFANFVDQGSAISSSNAMNEEVKCCGVVM